MKKKVLAIVMALALVISVCACKKDDSSETRSKRNSKTEDKDRDDDDDDDDDKDDKDDDDDDDDDDDAEETTKKTKKTKATTEETEEPDDTEEETTTTKETSEETSEDTDDTDETEETTKKGTTASSVDMGDFFNYDPSDLKNKAAAEWVQDLMDNGALVMDMDDASSMAGNSSSFPAGTKGFTAIDSSYTKTYVYLEIAMGNDFTEDQLKAIGDAMKQQGYDTEMSGDCMILTSTAQNAYGVIDLKTGYYFFAVGVTGMPDVKEEAKVAKQLGFSV